MSACTCCADCHWRADRAELGAEIGHISAGIYADVPQQYDIVQMPFTPQGGRDALLAVDAADAGLADLAPGRTVAIAYAAADPRAAQIIGATHAHHWRNMVAFGEISLGGRLLIGLLLALWAGPRTLFKRAKTA
jgi:hypothetical protein